MRTHWQCAGSTGQDGLVDGADADLAARNVSRDSSAIHSAQ